MLKRRLTLIFKVDNPLRLLRHTISGCDEIMRNFNILPHHRQQKRISLLPMDFFAPTRTASQKTAGSPQSLTMYL
jgi:hypothetical protein